MLLAIVAGLLAASQAVGAAVPARSPRSRPRRSRSLAQINELNASLDRSDELVNLANLKLAQVQRDIAMNRRELVIAQHNLAREPADDRASGS